MAIVEIMMLIILVILGGIASVSDIRKGIIPNKIVFAFAVVGIILDGIYYGVFSQDTFGLFELNLLVTTAISLGLYFSHSLAGGDCKLIPVMALLFPAGMYMTYGKTEITLFVAIFFAIFYGYIYMLVVSAWRIVIGEARVSKKDAIHYLLGYLKSYLIAFVYVTFVNLLFAVIDRNLFPVASWIVWIIFIVVAWISGRLSIMKKPASIVVFALLDIALSIYIRVLSFSLNWRTYIFTAILVLCQMTIRTNIYETVPTISAKKGMILSTFSSVMMQNSKVKGLPRVSEEDLRNRLTKEEAESIHRWGKTPKGQKEIIIVKKIPFAVFIALGYLTYFLIWRAVT